MNRWLARALLVGCTSPLLASAQPFSSYTIGNSLSWDSQPDGIAAMAASQGIVLNDGYHIRASETLVYILANPNDVTLTNGYGSFSVALPNNAWNFVSAQPFPDYSGLTSTLGTDLSSINSLIALTQTGPSTHPKFYIYEAWPPTPCWCYPALPGETYSSWWDYPSANSPGSPTYLAEQYFYYLYSAVANANPKVSVYLIPVGEVLAQLDQDIQAGQFPEFSSIFSLYRDDYHLSFDVGRYVAAMTVFATYFGTSPVGVAVPSGYYTVDGTPTGAPGLLATNIGLRDRLAQVVWQVVSNDSRTGVAAPPVVAVTASTIQAGQSSTLSVTAGGPGPFTYQWYRGKSGDTSTPVGSNSSSFTTPALGSTTNYWVQITSAIGIVENSATITIHVAGSNSGVPATDGPIPIWALGVLGAGLAGIASRRLRKAAKAR